MRKAPENLKLTWDCCATLTLRLNIRSKLKKTKGQTPKEKRSGVVTAIRFFWLGNLEDHKGYAFKNIRRAAPQLYMNIARFLNIK